MINKIIQLIVGHVILTFGVSLIILSELGAGAWDTVFIGLMNAFGLTIGIWSFIVKLLLIVVVAIMLRARPDWKALIGLIMASVFIDFWMELVFKDVVIESILLRCLLLILGISFLGLGIATYIRVKFFNGPVDGLMIATSKIFKLSIRNARISNEVLAAMIGLLLGGPVGVGTLLVAFGLGFSIQNSFMMLDKLKEKGIKVI